MAFGWDKIEKCDICGDEVKNIGHHKYFHHREKIEPGTLIKVDKISDIDETKLVVDEVLQVPLSVIVLAIKDLLRQFQNSMEIKISEQNGKPFEVQIITVIKL